MTVRVLFFASLQNVVGSSELPFDVADGATASDLFQQLSLRWQGLGPYRKVLRVACGAELVGWDHVLHAGDEVALLPPVSGG